MKNAMTVFGAIIFASLIFTSCGGGKKEYSIKPSSTNVKGDLSSFFEVVDGSYKLEKGAGKYDNFKMKIQLKRKGGAFDFDAKDLESRGYFGLCCSLLGEGGTPVVLGSFEGMGVGTAYEGRKELITLKDGEVSWVEFTFGSGAEMEKVKTFDINSSVDKGKQMSSSDDSGSSTSTSSSVDCDKFITDYEAFVRSYIKILKKYKANPSDASILTEYTEAAQKASEMQTNANNCTDPKYASRLLRLSTKLAEALQ